LGEKNSDEDCSQFETNRSQVCTTAVIGVCSVSHRASRQSLINTRFI